MPKFTHCIYTLLFLIVSCNSYSQEMFNTELIVGKWSLDFIESVANHAGFLAKASYKKTIVFYDNTNFELNILLKDTTITSKGRWEYKKELLSLSFSENINGRTVNQLFFSELRDGKELTLTRFIGKQSFHEYYIKE